MARSRTSLRSLVAGVVVAAAVTLVPAGAASAGGWAVTTLDPLPELEPGATVEIGFTVRQHGVTPVDLEDTSLGSEAATVGIAFVSSNGRRQVFPAEGEGPVGHYIAPVTVPAAGEYEWEVLQGWFATQELGRIEIADRAPVAPPSTGDEGPEWLTALRWSLLGLAIALGGVAGFDLVARRRRHEPATATHEPT